MSLNVSSPEELHSGSSLRELGEISNAAIINATTTEIPILVTASASAIATATINANEVKPTSRPPSILPNILASLAPSTSSSSSSSATSPANISSGKQQHQSQQQQQHERDGEHTSSPCHQQHQSMTTSHSNTPRSSSSPIFEMATHSTSPPPPHSDRSSSGSTSAGAPQQFCLRWNNYQSNLTSVFDQLLQSESFVDVTLACDGRSIKAHKMVLSACSPYFQSLFFDTPCRHPIVIMKDVGWHELKTIVEFMYKGEINVNQDQIGPILRIAEMLKVRGLADVGNIETSTNTVNRNDAIDPTISPPIKRQRSHSPPEKRSQNHHRPLDFEGDPIGTTKDFLFFAEPEKKAQLNKTSLWNIDTNISSRGIAGIGSSHSINPGMEMRLSPLPLPLPLPPSPLPSPHTSLLQRSARKRRWTSADALFNSTASPLSGLIAAERAEQEQERARQRERECEHLMLTSPIPISTGGSNHHLSGCKNHNVITSVPATNSLQKGGNSIGTSSSNSQQNQSITNVFPSLHTPTDVTSSPHLQASQSLQPNTSHHSQETSPAQSIASTRPSSVFSSGGGTGNNGSGPGSGRCGIGSGMGGGGRDSHLTPSPAGITPSPSSNVGESHRFPAVSVQAAAMAAAVAHIDLTPSPHGPLGMRSHSSPGIPLGGVSLHHHPSSLADDLEIKPGIAEMIREEERAKMLESTHAWMSSGPSSIADSYQYQLQSMWQKCWNTNQSLMHHLRFRERGPLKSWRPETMAEAIFSVLKEGLSLSQAARKYDIPYPTFVLYANRVHNMLGPSIDGGPDLRPKGRGRPQRILLGIWPDEHIKGVIKTVVFRDAKDLKEEAFAVQMPYGRHSPIFPFQDAGLNYGGPGGQCSNGIPPPTGDHITQEATAAAVAAVAHNFRQQMQLAAAQQQQHVDSLGPAGLFNMPQHITAIGSGAGGPSPLTCPPGSSNLILPKASISPALSTTSNPGGGISIVGPRHAPSPCATAVPGMHQLPPSMAAALQMVGASGRCETATMMNQQQHQQLQQLHIQQQTVMQHHQKYSHSHQSHQHHQPPHQHQHQHHHQQMLFGTSSIGHPSSMPAARALDTTSIAGSSQQTSTTKSSMCTMPSSSERQRHRLPSDNVTLRSTLTDFGFDLDHNKTSRSITPTRLFPDDIAELVGVASSRNHRTLQEVSTSNIMAIPKATTQSDIMTSSVSSIIATLTTTTVTTTSTTTTTTTTTTATTSTTSNKCSSNVKLEPIITTSI